jgi:N-methylhydantoinase B
MNNLMMGGTLPKSGEKWAFYETIGGGYGGRHGLDGVNGVQVNMTNTLNTPIEVMEHYYPIIFESYSLRPASGGAGQWRGGVGIERAFRALAPIQVSLLGERKKVRPWGVDGGLSGQPSDYLIRREIGGTIHLGAKDSTVLVPGDVLIIRTAGGGGYGDPNRRDPRLVEADIEDGYT